MNQRWLLRKAWYPASRDELGQPVFSRLGWQGSYQPQEKYPSALRVFVPKIKEKASRWFLLALTCNDAGRGWKLREQSR